MTTSLVRPQLYTVAEYLELGETESGYSELVEGRVVFTPSPYADHNYGVSEARDQLKPQVPPEYEVILDIDVDLQLAPPDAPGFVRRPDLIVVLRTARQRQRREGGVIRASEVAIVMECLSPGSLRTDRNIKKSEYADAGIPHYWLLDVTEPVSMTADGGEVTGRFSTDAPFPLTLDLDTLL